MKATIEATSKVVTINGLPARIWEGTTESGIPFHAFITRVAVSIYSDNSQFETELKETKAPSAITAAFPSRMVL